MLNIPTPTVQASPYSSSDLFVAWIDKMLYNNGQPLAVGSTPLYGSDRNTTAFAALDQGIAQAITLVASMPTPFGMGFALALATNDFINTGDPTGLIIGAAGIATMLNPCEVMPFAGAERGGACHG